MSKSYDNHIPLFAPRAQLKKLIDGIVTDSRAPGEPKPTELTHEEAVSNPVCLKTS